MKNINMNILNPYLENYENGYNKELTTKENKISYMQKQLPEKSANEIEEIVEGLYSGCILYKEQLDAALEGKKLSIKETFVQQLEDKPIEEKYAFATKLLLAIQAIDENVIADNADDVAEGTAEKIRELLNGGVEITPGTVNSDSLDELLDKLDEAINSTSFGFYGCENILKLIENMDENETISFVEDFWKNEEVKATMSMLAYIAYLKGEYPEFEGEISPEEMAIIVSGEIDKDATIKRASAGQIAWDVAKVLLVMIGVGSVVALSIVAISSFVTASISFGALALAAVFGESVIAGIIGSIVGALFASKFVDWLCNELLGDKDIIEATTDFICVTVDKVRETCTKIKNYVKETVVPVVQEKSGKVWNFVNNKIIGGVIRGYKALKLKLNPGL